MRNLLPRIYTLSLFVIIASATSWSQSYQIDIHLKGLSNDTIILGEYMTTRMVPLDTLVLDKDGRGSFRGETALTGGLYLIYISPEAYFDFLLGDDQELSISSNMSDLHNSISFSGSEDNTVFQEYKSFLQEKRQELQVHQESLKTAVTSSDSLTAKEHIKTTNLAMESYMDDLETAHGDLFVITFIGATREPIPPAHLLSGDKRHDDSLRYFYYREHYLDRFDPFDVRLLHTPLYENKLKGYLTRVVPQHPDSLKVASDFLLQGSKSNDELYRYMLITLFNHFAESKFMGMDAVYFHIAEHYYIPDATWSSEDFIAKLKDNLEKNKSTLIGEKAPNLILREVDADHFHMAAQDTAIKRDPHIGHDFFLHDVEAEYTILYFWEGDCGHCKKATPALYEVAQRLQDKNVQVLSVHVINTIEGKELWVDFVNEHGLYNWINCWSPYSNEFRKLYNLQSYPQLFIFDRDKTIIAKKVTPEQAEQIINNHMAIAAKKD